MMTGLLILLFISTISVSLVDVIKILSTPRVSIEDVDQSAAFAKLETNFSEPKGRIINSLTACLWILKEFEDFGLVWTSDDFRVLLNARAWYLVVDGVSMKLRLPINDLTPKRWFLLCFSYDNVRKQLIVYHNAVKIHESIIKDHLDNFSLTRKFLTTSRFVEAGRFAQRKYRWRGPTMGT